MNIRFLLGFLLLSLTASGIAAASPLEILVEKGCDKVLEGLLITYLNDNQTLVSIYEDKSGSQRRLDSASFKLCKDVDLDQGSWSLRREVTFCNPAGDSVVLYTQGNLWCDDEQVLGIASISLAKPVANGTSAR